MSSTTRLAIGAGGGLLGALTLADLFVTVFAYDNFRFMAPVFQRMFWRALRLVARPLPDRVRHAMLSLGSTALLPATLFFWLMLEITAFALMYVPGVMGPGFALTNDPGRGVGSAFYLAAGALTTLTFGDYIPRTPIFRALVDLEAVVGLATFTLGLTYVLSAFDATAKLTSLYARVRRNAVAPRRPSSILQRRLRAGGEDELASFLAGAVEDIDAYNQALHRFPVAFYFHTRQLSRATPAIFDALGEVIELVRFGLPSSEALTSHPDLLALLDGYSATLEQLQDNFVGPKEYRSPEPPSREEFEASSHDPTSIAGQFQALRAEAQRAAGLADEDPQRDVYRRFTDWQRFHHHRTVLLRRVATALGYAPDHAEGP